MGVAVRTVAKRACLVLMVAGPCTSALGASADTACRTLTSAVCSPDGVALGLVWLFVALGGVLVFTAGLVAYLVAVRGALPVAAVVRTNVAGAHAYCPICGESLAWVGPAGRWRCPDCGTYW